MIARSNTPRDRSVRVGAEGHWAPETQTDPESRSYVRNRRDGRQRARVRRRERGGTGRFPIPVGYGESIGDVGSIDDPELAAAIRERLKPTRTFADLTGRPDTTPSGVGFRYRYLLLGVPLWTWDGVYCVYRGSRYVEISKSDAAALLHVSEADLKTPFFYRIPLGWVVLLAGIPISLVAWKFAAAAAERRRRRAEELYASSFRIEGAGRPDRVGSVLLRDDKE